MSTNRQTNMSNRLTSHTKDSTPSEKKKTSDQIKHNFKRKKKDYAKAKIKDTF